MRLENPRDRVSSRESFDVRDVPSNSSNYTQRGARKYGNGRHGVTGPVLVICAVVAVLVAANYWMNHGKIYSGVAVGDVALGGKTPEEAREMLEEREADAFEKIRFTEGLDEEAFLTAEEMGLDLDVSGTVGEAYAAGREGGNLESIGERMKAARGTLRVPPVVNYEREAVRTRIEDLAGRANAEPQDAYVSMSGAQAEVVESSEGYVVDIATTIENVSAAIENLSGEADLVAETLQPEVSDAQAQAAAEEAELITAGAVSLTAEGEEWELTPRESEKP